MEKENDVFDEFMKEMFKVEPIDRVLLLVLRWNPHVKASFNKELGIWDF